MAKPLTKSQFHKLKIRVDEITKTIDLCDADNDGDIIDNLCLELEEIIITLENSIKLTKIFESGLRLCV